MTDMTRPPGDHTPDARGESALGTGHRRTAPGTDHDTARDPDADRGATRGIETDRGATRGIETDRGAPHGTDADRAAPHGSDADRAAAHGTEVPATDRHGTDLHGTDLPGTDRHGTDRHGTDLPGTDRHGTDLHGTDLPGTDRHGTDLPGSDRHGSDLPGTNPHGTHGTDRLGGEAHRGDHGTGPDKVGPAINRAHLLGHDDCDKFGSQLQHAVAGFVDGPRAAVEEADHVLEEIAARFTEAVTQRRRTLRHSWQSVEGGEGRSVSSADTEQLRLALKDYRELAERLLHV
ncbi:pentapeptide repeat-containing protein [Streptomyces massasporeus]|uniref:pentapeptide repeat-containing protein n=1 Tax=Streptomyces massasporeus TaxID=67324 RepID=UPI0037B6F43E